MRLVDFLIQYKEAPWQKSNNYQGISGKTPAYDHVWVKQYEDKIILLTILSKDMLIVDYTGEYLTMVPPGEWANYVNELVEQKAYIGIQERVSIEDEVGWLVQKRRQIKDGKLVVIMEVSAGGRLLGNCEVRKKSPKPYEHNIYFGLSVRPSYQRQGIGERLLRKGIEVAKDYFNAKNLLIEVVDGNIPAINLYKKLGFRPIARYPNYYNYYGEFRDMIAMLLPVQQ